MIKLFLDIETLPGDETLRERIEAEVQPPRNISRPERIKQWEEEEKLLDVEKKYRGTSLKGHLGRILCIGYIKEIDGSSSEDVITGDEPGILKKFWDIARDVDLFVGFNILEFDLKFIMQRSIICGVKPSLEVSFARYRKDQVYDVMEEWGMWGRDYISLDELCKSLGVESPKSDLDGSKVYDYYLAGRQQEIYDYCLKDVRATRELYRRMNFLA